MKRMVRGGQRGLEQLWVKLNCQDKVCDATLCYSPQISNSPCYYYELANTQSEPGTLPREGLLLS